MNIVSKTGGKPLEKRACPQCKMCEVEISKLYPDGTSCLSCGAHIEVDAMFNLLTVGLLIILMVLDFNFWQIDYIGFFSAGALFANAFSHRFINARIMPLKHYEDDSSL